VVSNVHYHHLHHHDHWAMLATMAKAVVERTVVTPDWVVDVSPRDRRRRRLWIVPTMSQNQFQWWWQ